MIVSSESRIKDVNCGLDVQKGCMFFICWCKNTHTHTAVMGLLSHSMGHLDLPEGTGLVFFFSLAPSR